MDTLDRLIELSQVKASVHTHCLFQGQWKIEHASSEQYEGLFHLIEQGECFLQIANQQFHLRTGDIFFLPRVLEHQIRSQSTDLPASNVIREYQQGAFRIRQIGEQGAPLKMFCGSFQYAKPSSLIESLPPYLHLALGQQVSPLIALFQQEATTHKEGSQLVINALAQVLFAYILRQALTNSAQNQNLLAGLQDKRLKGVLQAITQAPHQDWNIEALAALAAMSRANFIRVFQQKLGIAPGKFVTQLRLQQAAMLLANSQKNVLSIALEVGYQTEAHFSKAFKAQYGVPPSQYRKALA